MALELLPKRETHWKKITVEEARKFLNKTVVIWWRPNLEQYSRENPDNDPVWIAIED